MITLSFHHTYSYIHHIYSPKRTFLALLMAGFLITMPISTTKANDIKTTIKDPPSEVSPHLTNKEIFTNNDLNSIRINLLAGISFIEPRSLDAHSIEELSLWGINGILEIDSNLSIKHILSRHHDTLLLQYHDTPILKYSTPDKNDQKGWINAISDLIQAGSLHSPLLNEAGNNRIISYFYGNLFHHLDIYSRYIDPIENSTLSRKSSNDTCSIGITLIRHKEVSYPVITSVNMTSSAWERGIDVGYTLIAIDGHDVKRVPISILNHWLIGAPNSKIIITVRSPSKKIKTIALKRTKFSTESIFSNHYGHYPVLKITHFSEHTAEEVSQYLSTLIPDDFSQEESSSNKSSKTHIPGLIVDLRGNHGGLLQQAVVTATLFLNKGIVTSTEGRFPEANHLWTIVGGDILNKAPIAILVDGQTASSAEVFASALADHHRAAIIGSNTYGKGLVQIVDYLPNNASIFLSWGRNIAPLGWPIEKLGVFPQLCTAQSNITAQLIALKKGDSLEKESIIQARNQRKTTSSYFNEIRSRCPPSLGTSTDMKIAEQLLSSMTMYQTALKSVPAYP